MKSYLLKPEKKGIVRTTMPWLAQNVKHMVFCHNTYFDLLGACLEAIYSPYERIGVIICSDTRETMESTRLAGYKQNMAVYSYSTIESLKSCFDDTVVSYPKVVGNTIAVMKKKDSKKYLESNLDLERMFPVVAVNHELVEKRYFENLVLQESPKYFNGRVMENDSMLDIYQLADKACRIGIYYIFEKINDRRWDVLSTDGTPIPDSTMLDKSMMYYEDKETTLNELWKFCVFKAVNIIIYRGKRDSIPTYIDEATINAALAIPDRNFQEAWNMLTSRPIDPQ